MKDEALKLALEALENSVDLVREDAYEAEKLYGNYPSRQGKVAGLKVLADDHEKAITAIKQALAAQPAPVQEPVALEALAMICVKCRSNEWGPDTPRKEILNWFHDFASKALDDATPPAAQRKWIGLADEEVYPLANEHLHHQIESYEVSGIYNLARAIEARLKELNT